VDQLSLTRVWHEVVDCDRCRLREPAGEYNGTKLAACIAESGEMLGEQVEDLVEREEHPLVVEVVEPPEPVAHHR
jgi:hypothetical protein